MRNFLWGSSTRKRKICWVGWNKICKPKWSGGLGIRNLLKTNSALLSKWVWRYGKENDSLWRRVIEAKYGGARGNILPTETNIPYGTGLWRHILKHKKNITNNSTIRVNNGDATLFWIDKWIGEAPLKESFPKIFKLSRCKKAPITEVITDGNGLDFRFSRVVNNEERRELIDLVQLLEQANPLGEEEDELSCKFDSEMRSPWKSKEDLVSYSFFCMVVSLVDP
ncbi:hypothetical protein BVC80_1231g1 [Macleaya cordata]|uniref:Reverse transcriptase zinc-binding domain n=1 Tax=Macleaya cordata TaxID=56857 RepID=A0A200R2F3_MACCD|nr:hypothetical protein BVC80_1231g1 [Macleaya cordata]